MRNAIGNRSCTAEVKALGYEDTRTLSLYGAKVRRPRGLGLGDKPLNRIQWGRKTLHRGKTAPSAGAPVAIS